MSIFKKAANSIKQDMKRKADYYVKMYANK